MPVSLAALALVAGPPAEKGSALPLNPGWAPTDEFPADHATQAAAADGRSFYAVSNTHVAAHDRATGRLLAAATAPTANHLNSAVVWKGKVFCAHSNYPAKPDESDVRVYDPAANTLSVFHMFASPPGSLVWVVPDRADGWWLCWARYGADNGKTVLAKTTADFKEERRWAFPRAVVADWDGMSASGGVWDGNTLLVSHHHWKVLYRLRVPADGAELELVEALVCPFPGQGIAADPVTGGLVGIDRKKRAVVFAESK